jgi:hypothetical protein
MTGSATSALPIHSRASGAAATAASIQGSIRRR